MDVKREEFIIFLVHRGEAPGLYIWVRFGKLGPTSSGYRFTAIEDLMLYSKWTGEAMNVSGHFPAKIDNQAMSILLGLPDVEIVKALDAFEAQLKSDCGLNKYEGDILPTVEWTKKNKGIMRMF